jgi:SpoVK/Ycf46/Vps4 family AAA+-type ATPase
MSTSENQLNSVRDELLSLIESSGKGSTRIKTKNLLARFNFVALQRVRRDSLDRVERELASWGIECRFPADISVDSFVWLTRSSPTEKAAPPPAVAPHVLPSSSSEEPQPLPPDPITSFFHINGSVDATTAQSLHYRLTAAVWAGRPVLLLTQASEDLFAFVAGYMAALMRRRHLTSRRWRDMDGWPRAPQIVTTTMLKALTGQTASAGEIDHSFPCAGAVYLLRDHPDQADEDDLAAFVREAFIPHSYRLEERPVGDIPSSGETIGRDGTWLAPLVRWLPALAGAPSHSIAVADRALSPQLATLLAEAAHAQDALLDDAALRSLPASFQAGFESTEHMLLKGIMLEYLQRRYPQDKVLVEQVIESIQEVDDEDAPFEKPQKVKPDLHITGKLCVEVETLRDICLKGSNPFVSLEAKLRKKLPALSQFPQIWVLVPSDVALLGRHQMSALVRDLAQAMGKSDASVRFGFVDAERRQPVLVTPEAPPRLEIELRGVSWRSPEQKAERPLSLEDIAGYSDLKKIIKSDVLDPLLNRERYTRYGLSGANGLLLYGLPGCGKSLVGKVLAGMASLTCRRLLPSDLSSMWLGQGVEKIRDVFDWAIKQTPCLLIIDEIDGVAPQRSDHNMHSDERRQVNELLAQLDRIAGKPVTVVATTNYMRGIDTAIQRSGRFDLRVPVFPPTQEDRAAIFSFYLRRHGAGSVAGIDTLDIAALAAQTRLFTPSDIKAVVELALRRAVFDAGQRGEGQTPMLNMESLRETLRQHQRSIQRDDALRWIEEAQIALGASDDRLRWLTEEVSAAYGI